MAGGLAAAAHQQLLRMQQAGLAPGHLPSLQDLQAMQARRPSAGHSMACPWPWSCCTAAMVQLELTAASWPPLARVFHSSAMDTCSKDVQSAGRGSAVSPGCQGPEKIHNPEMQLVAQASGALGPGLPGAMGAGIGAMGMLSPQVPLHT